MGLRSFGDIGNAISDAGKYHYQYVYKPATPNNVVASNFIDCGQSTGAPKYQPYAGASATAFALTGAGNDGVYTGPTLSGHSKRLLSWQSIIRSAGAPSHVFLLDYLLVYPLIDCDDTDTQVMDNTVTLPRHIDGKGVRLILVGTAPMATGSLVTVTYTNDQGTPGRISSYNCFPSQGVGICSTASGFSSVTNTLCTPFWPLADGDTGMRSIDSVQFAASNGGFLAFILVKPIAQKNLLESDVPVEKVFGVDTLTLPEIQPGAYLNFMMQKGGTAGASPYLSELVFINVQE